MHGPPMQESVPFLHVQSEATGGLAMVLLTVVSAIGGFLFGYDTGVVSGALLELADDFHLSEWQQEAVVSITTVGAVIGSMIGGQANEAMGRKPVILLSSVIFTVGAIVMGAAPNLTVLLIGRLTVGLAIGFSSMSIPMYIAESAPAASRGRLVTTNCVFITGGQVIAGMVDGLLSRTPDGWRYMLGLAAVPAVVQLLGVLFLPESPRWLVSRGRSEEAAAVLMRLRATSDVAFEMEEIKQTVAEHAGLPRARLRDLWATPAIRRAVVLGCGLMLLQQLAGVNTIMYYSASIYRMAGFGTSWSIWLAGFTAMAQFVGMLASMLLVERLGRRTLLLSSLAAVIMALLAIGLSFYLSLVDSAPVLTADSECSSVSNVILGSLPVETCFRCVQIAGCGYCPSESACLKGNATMDVGGTCSAAEWEFQDCTNDYGYLSVVAMVLYLLAFGLGMGNVPWTINAEIYPLHIRSVANSVSTSVNWLGNVLVSATFLSLASPHVLTQYGAFWLYAAISISGFIGLYYTMPETRGVPLEEIELLFSKPGDRADHYQPISSGGSSSIQSA